MHKSALTYMVRTLWDVVPDRSVIEVGAYDVNGSIRPLLEPRAGSYLGVDMALGPRVDQVVNCVDLITTFGCDQFDVVACAEMLEHAAEWRECLVNMAGVLAPGGVLALTTRSPGFPYHPFPEDHWRFPLNTMTSIIAALGLSGTVIDDWEREGVFVTATKPDGWTADEARRALATIDAVPVTR